MGNTMIMEAVPQSGKVLPENLWINRADLTTAENRRKLAIFQERARRMEHYLKRVFGIDTDSGTGKTRANKIKVEGGQLQQQEGDKPPVWLRPLVLLAFLMGLNQSNDSHVSEADEEVGPMVLVIPVRERPVKQKPTFVMGEVFLA